VCKNGPKGPAHMALSVREFLASKLSHVLVTKAGFGSVNGFINHSQVVTIINYNSS
jgi:hypothetical protein